MEPSSPPVAPNVPPALVASCSHVRVPAAPFAAGYRYVDLGGDVPPFYLRRFERDGATAALTLRAPLELTGGEAAEPGAPGIAKAIVTLGARIVPWQSLGVERSAARGVLDDVLDELAALELLRRGECPLCSLEALPAAS